MVVDIRNLPAGWGVGRVGRNRVFSTPEGRQISEREAEERLSTAFSGFERTSDDPNLVPGFIGSSVQTPTPTPTPTQTTQPTQENGTNGIQVSRPPVMDGEFDGVDQFSNDLEDAEREASGFSLMNGASDGAGNPDPVDINPLGETDSTMGDGLTNTKVSNFSPLFDGVTKEATNQKHTLNKAFFGDYFEHNPFYVGNVPVAEMQDSDFRNLIGDGDEAEAEDRPAYLDAESLDEFREGLAKELTERGATPEQIDAVTSFAQPSSDFVARKWEHWFGSGTDGQPENPEITTSKQKVEDFQSIYDRLGSGDTDAVLEDYQSRLRGEGTIGSEGRPDQPSITFRDPETGVDTDHVVFYDATQTGVRGWGYLGIDKTTGRERFIITDESMRLGLEFLKDEEQFDQMEAFVERMAADQSASARDRVIREEMAYLQDLIGDENERQAQINEQANINLQADRSDFDRRERQRFEQSESELSRNLTRTENSLGRLFTTQERLALEEYKDTVRESERVLALQDMTRQEVEAERIRLDQKAIRALEVSQGREFTTQERLAFQEFQESVRASQEAYQTEERLAGQEEAERIRQLQRQGQIDDREDRQRFEEAESLLQRTFTTDEREAIEAFQKADRLSSQEYQTEERLAGEQTAREADLQRQQYQSGERRSSEQTARNVAQQGREYQTEERIAGEQTARSTAALLESRARDRIEQGQGYQTGERVAGEKTARSVATTADERAAADREDRQANEEFQREQTQQFNTARDTIEFDRQSRLESVRLGIADATSPEGIDRAVELAEEARGLDRAQTMLDVIEQISSSGLGRQLQDSGILEQLAAEFGVDLSFLTQGGLGSGIGGRSPVRVTL
jgi:hypothetical protein